MFVAKRSTRAASQKKNVAASEQVDSMAPLPVPLNTTGLASPLDSRSLTSALLPALEGSTLSRVPIVIKGNMKRTEPLPPPTREARCKHSKRLWILGMAVLMITLATTLLTITPQGRAITAKFDPRLAGQSNVISNQQNNAAQVSALATTTWMYQNDGYDPYSHGQVNVTDGKSSLPWPYGQCTYWANYRYHQLTGFWVQWTGNADQWFLGAQKAGWDYGQKPPPGIPSIIVLMPYVQQAGGVGHVAVVESISGNVVHTSNMNWGYGGWTHTEWVDFTLGSGVYFVWHKPVN